MLLPCSLPCAERLISQQEVRSVPQGVLHACHCQMGRDRDQTLCPNGCCAVQDAAPMEIQDQTETNVINLRRTIYLTIMSAMDFEEAGHKLMKIELRDGQENEIVLMIIECCSQEKTYLKYGPLA